MELIDLGCLILRELPYFVPLAFLKLQKSRSLPFVDFVKSPGVNNDFFYYYYDEFLCPEYIFIELVRRF